MVCPGTSAWNTVGGRWHNAAGNIRNFAAAGLKHGAEGLLNTDWGDNGHRQFLAVSLMGFAFGAAESWNPGAADVAGFPRSFARHAFNQPAAKLGDAIEALGRVYLQYDAKPNQDPMYFNLDQPLTVPSFTWGRTVDLYPPAELAGVLGSLPPASAWAAPADDEFDRLALAEYALSARTLAVYCLRSSIAWDLGLGRKVPAATLRHLASELDALAADFRRLWLARNKPSRLGDNMRRFRRASAERGSWARGRQVQPTGVYLGRRSDGRIVT